MSALAPQAADSAARTAAQTCFDRPLAVEAGAGTGKTSVLVARVVAWCLGPGWERHEADREGDEIAARVLSRVVAITFTEAAAAEMATRVARAFRDLEADGAAEGVELGALPDRELVKPRAAALLGALDRLHVQTIHSYCHRLLTSFPIEGQVHPDFRVDADESVRAEQVRALLERALRERWGDGRDPAFRTLARRTVGPDVLEACLLTLIDRGVPAEALEEEAFSDARLAAFRADLRTAAKELRAANGGRLEAVSRSKRGTHIAPALDAIDATLDGPIAELVNALAEHCTPSMLSGLRAWSKGRFNKDEAAALADDAGDVQRAARALRGSLDHALRLDPELLEAVRAALLPLLREAESELRARGVQSYDGLLRDTHRLLVEHPAVGARVRADVDQILVDEFQDTDQMQCEILAVLAFGGKPRPGLFLVGDPKQSIYGWRSADLAAYEAFTARVLEEGGEQHALVVNFRSVPAILREVARVIRPAMRAVPHVQPAFHELEPARPDAQTGPAVEYWVSWGRIDENGPPSPVRAGATAAVEAKAVAADLAVQQRRGARMDEIGLLFRTRTDYDVYLSELRTAGVPYSVEGDRSFFRRREIIDAAALVRCVLDPDDPLALLTWLRSAAVGVPDAALLPLWRAGLPRLVARNRIGSDGLAECVRTAAAHMPEDVPGLERVADWDASLVHALDVLQDLRVSFDREAPDVFVDRLRSHTAIEATEAARALGAFRLANLDRFLRRFTHELCAGVRDPQNILRSLRRAVREAQDEEEGRTIAPAPAAVRVMTIHQAKGLDFEQVYVVQTHRDPSPRFEPRPICAEHDGQWEYQLAGKPTPGFARVQERERVVREAETVRTLYVALTRAKNRLVLLGGWPEAGPLPGSHLRLLHHREGGVPALGELARRCTENGSGHVDVGELRWTFPVLAPTSASDADASKPRSDRLERARDDATLLAGAHEAATSRARRPLRGAASQEAHDRLEELFAEPAPTPGPMGRRLLSRAVATRVGTEIHRFLEELDLHAEPSAAFARQRDRLRARLASDPEARDAADALLSRLQTGGLLQRLFALRDSVVARELPVVLAGSEDGDGPLQALEGVIDLVYRDPESDAWVVADFKTDPELEGRLEPYAAQGAVYARALKEGLELEAEPRVELWLLDADRIEAVS